MDTANGFFVCHKNIHVQIEYTSIYTSYTYDEVNMIAIREKGMKEDHIRRHWNSLQVVINQVILYEVL